MTYGQTIDYLFQRLPMFTRTGSAALKEGLGNIILFTNHLGKPQDNFLSVHVAGTNGKGSTSHMLAAIFQQAGYKTGLYTSPHLRDFRERIRVNGKMVSKKFVVDFVRKQKEKIEEIDPSFFEVTVAMAFEYFKQQGVTIAIVEVGLGGRLDSTNIISPVLSVITNISLDHTNLLGTTLPSIATEKAGIIKPGVPVIIGEYDPETAAVFIKKAAECATSIEFADQQLHIEKSRKTDNYLVLSLAESFQDLELDLTGGYQKKNILTVVSSICKLREIGFSLSDHSVRYALKHVKQLTGLAGRWQKLSDNPLTICDTGHNEAGFREIVLNIANTKYTDLHMVIGMVKDKDIEKVLDLLPKRANYYFCAPQLERALPAVDLQKNAAKFQLSGKAYNSVSKAVEAAQLAASQDDMIFIGGSTFVVAEIV